MNGAGQGKIKFGDGLEQYPEEKLTNNTFDVLVANPPYSVDGFKVHLKLKNNCFELLDRNLISNEGSEIETLFVERIAQLLKPHGFAAVILPSTILSNVTPRSYIVARELLLQNFYLRAVVQFGNKTFGATSTSTVVLYLEKYNEPPKKCEIIKDIVNAIISGNFSDDWEDSEVFKYYTQKIGVSEDLYRAFATETATKDDLGKNEYFAQYLTWFENLTEIVNRQKSKRFRQLTADDQERERKELFYKTVKDVEQEKLTYFALVYKQNTFVINAPIDIAEQKKFLGYEWSNRKRSEGIQINQPGGMLYNDSNRYADDTLAAAVRNSFENREIILPETLKKYCSYLRTQDMIDFSRTIFNKTIKLSIPTEIESRFPLEKLGAYVSIEKGVSFDKDVQVSNETKNVVLTADNITLDGHFNLVKKLYIAESVVFDEKKKLKRNDCFMCFSSGSIQHVGKTAFIEKNLPYYAGGFMGILRSKNDKRLLPKFLYEILNLETMRNLIRSYSNGSNIQNLSNVIENIKIPVPDPDIQKQIVSECEKVDEKYNCCYASADEYTRKIEDLFNSLDKKATKSIRLSNKEVFDISIGQRVLNSEVNPNFDIPVYSANVFEPFGMIDKLLIEDFSKDSVLWGIDGDWMVNVISANNPFYPTDHCGVLRIKTDNILPKYMAHLLEEAGKQAEFSRSYRPSIDRIESLIVKIAPIEEQRKAVSEIEIYEQKITEAKIVMASCAEHKKQILDKWLK